MHLRHRPRCRCRVSWPKLSTRPPFKSLTMPAASHPLRPPTRRLPPLRSIDFSQKILPGKSRPSTFSSVLIEPRKSGRAERVRLTSSAQTRFLSLRQPNSVPPWNPRLSQGPNLTRETIAALRLNVVPRPAFPPVNLTAPRAPTDLSDLHSPVHTTNASERLDRIRNNLSRLRARTRHRRTKPPWI